ncbi:MAG: glycoside hydrolase, partial [Armatimonadetes bacterium]|nr:glycoside hydrolase [Armatimonadota bacterium]
MGASELQLVEDFAKATPGALPPPWRGDPESAWRISLLGRPRINREFWPAVDSPHMHVAFPVIAACPKTGRLYVVYRQGYTHASHMSARDGAIMMVTSDDDGETWSRPRCIFDDPDIDDRNPAVAVLDDGTVVVCFDQYKRHWHFRAAYISSCDGGNTWSEAQTLGDFDNLTCRSRPIQLSTGEVVFPVYRYTAGLLGGYAVFVDMETGRQEQRTVCGYEEDLPPADEMTLFEVEPGRMLALLRDECQPFLWQAWSSDGGRTWTGREPTDLPSQFAPCDLLRLADGRIACALAFRERRNERLVISEDGGRTWDVENSIDIFDATVGFHDRSYVSSVALRDGGVGSVLYETEAYPGGGRIWFARTAPEEL